MKLSKLTLGLLAPLALAVSSFTPPKISNYKIDETKSKLTWVGKKVTGEHTGNIGIASGTFTFEDNTIKGGTFEIKMSSINNTDLEDKEYNAKLVKHLKSDDFFSTEKFPTATFVISSITPKGKDQYDVVGNLMIKNITNEIKFPAIIVTKGNNLVATAKIIVDRTKYDIKYGSKSFFESIGDKAIYDDFEMSVDLRATKLSL